MLYVGLQVKLCLNDPTGAVNQRVQPATDDDDSSLVDIMATQLGQNELYNLLWMQQDLKQKFFVCL